MEHRAETSNLTEGVGQLRWGDSDEVARKYYPAAKSSPGRVGRNPATGETIVIPSGLRIPSLISLNGTHDIDARVTLGQKGIEKMSLSLGGEGAGPDELETSLRALEERLGFGPVQNQEKQSWNVHGCKLDLWLERGEVGSDYTLTIQHLPRVSP